MSIRPSVLVPAGWSFERCPDTDVDLLLSRELPASGFRPRATLTSNPCALSLRDLLDSQVQQMRRGLAEVDVEEAEIQDLGLEDAAYVRVLHRLRGRDVITETWLWLVAEVAWTLTATVDLRDYADYYDVFETLAFSFRAS